MSLMDILSPYANRPTSTEDDFDEVAKQLPPDVLGDGIAQAFRSDKTPAFGEMVSRMFSGSNPSMQAGLLNQLIAAVGPAIVGKLSSVLGNRDTGGKPRSAKRTLSAFRRTRCPTSPNRLKRPTPV